MTPLSIDLWLNSNMSHLWIISSCSKSLLDNQCVVLLTAYTTKSIRIFWLPVIWFNWVLILIKESWHCLHIPQNELWKCLLGMDNSWFIWNGPWTLDPEHLQFSSNQPTYRGISVSPLKCNWNRRRTSGEACLAEL